MPKFIDIEPISEHALEKMGFSWHKDKDGEYIVKEKLLEITQTEAQAYKKAADTLYEMYEAGASYVIHNKLYKELDIPQPLISAILESWNNERGNHLYGRFDLSGGIDGEAIKLIEFNADTPTLLLESSLIQWMILHHSHLESKKQFNNIYEAIGQKSKEISANSKGDFTRFLFSCVRGIDEEYQTVKLLQHIVKDEGFHTYFSYLEDTEMQDESVCDASHNSYDFFFKLYPWEDMPLYEFAPKTQTLNPVYTLLYQSKGMLAILYTLFPDSPYLLETSFEPLAKKHVKKRVFGREGANIEIFTQDGICINKRDGIYAHYKSIYQEYVEFVKDKEGRHYQAGVFYSGEACGVGFRRGAEILDDMSQFIAHIVV